MSFALLLFLIDIPRGTYSRIRKKEQIGLNTLYFEKANVIIVLYCGGK